jgi:hypothetical protein
VARSASAQPRIIWYAIELGPGSFKSTCSVTIASRTATLDTHRAISISPSCGRNGTYPSAAAVIDHDRPGDSHG